MVVGDRKAQALGKECCCNRLVEIMKELGYREVETSVEQ